MTTYTITEPGDSTSGLTISEAADMLLTCDGFEYDIRRDGTLWRLFVSQHSRNSTLGGRPLVGSVIYSAEDGDEARLDIFAKVIRSGHWEREAIRCYTDEQYIEIMRETEVDCD